MSYQVIKLSNGEDIVCQVHQSKSSAETNKLKISYPLRMETVTRSTKKGVVELLKQKSMICLKQVLKTNKKFIQRSLTN